MFVFYRNPVNSTESTFTKIVKANRSLSEIYKILMTFLNPIEWLNNYKRCNQTYQRREIDSSPTYVFKGLDEVTKVTYSNILNRKRYFYKPLSIYKSFVCCEKK